MLRLDGLEKVKRIDLDPIDLTPSLVAATAPARELKAAGEALRQKISVPVITTAAADGKLTEWPENGWAPINAQTSFQMAVNGDNLVVAYRTSQPVLLRNSATEFPFAFTQGGGLDLMLRTTGSGQTRNILPGDIRLFVTKKDDRVLAVLYRQKAQAGGASQTFSSPVGEVTFDDVKDVSSSVKVASNGSTYELSVPLSVLGLANPSGKSFRGDAGIVLSDGTRARARIYWHNKADSMCADVPSEARLNPSQWGLLKFQSQ